jgi:pyridoxine 4-dehydrogenase
MLPIPGTSRVSHLEQNVKATSITLSNNEFDAISAAATK